MRLFFILTLTFSFTALFSQHRILITDGYTLIDKDTINRIKNSQKEGLWYSFNRGVEATNCFSGLPTVITVDNFTTVGHYHQGLKTGTWTYFYETGDIKKKEFYNAAGQKDSTAFEYFQNGFLKSRQYWKEDSLLRQEVFFENGKFHFEANYNKEGGLGFSVRPQSFLANIKQRVVQ